MIIKNSQRIFITQAEKTERNLCPLKDYKGKLLVLTNDDKKKITCINEQIAKLECEIYDINKQINNKLKQSRYEFWLNKLICCETKINELKELIKEIKIFRFNKQ